MKIPVPIGDVVRCKKVEDFKDASGFVLPNQEVFSVYEILTLGDTVDSSRFSVGDKIIVNSTGTKLVLDGTIEYLFRTENIIGKVIY